MGDITRRDALKWLAGAGAAAVTYGAARLYLGADSSPSAGTSTTPSPPTTGGPAPTIEVDPEAPVTDLAGRLGPVTIPAGMTARIVGDVDLAGDLVVEGVLTGVDAFTLTGNGHQLLVQHGGRLDLAGRPKSGWVRGAEPNGWETGDRVVTAPIEPGRTAPEDFEVASWPLPAAPGVALLDGRDLPAERFNLDRSIVIEGVSRIMIHHDAGPQSIRWVAVRDAGVADELGFYPIHFHRNGDTTRGSIVEGVVVERGRNRAFVPHGSHGITMVDCVAWDVTGTAFWWDAPEDRSDLANNSDDTTWEHCLAALVHPADDRGFRLSGFNLGAGDGNRAVDCTAVGVQGQKDASGFHWPEPANDNEGGTVWEFTDCVAHNNRVHGIFTWQNDSGFHPIDRFVAYHNDGSGIDHGAYVNRYRYRDLVLQGNGEHAIQSHATGRGDTVEFALAATDGTLLIPRHTLDGDPVLYRSCRFTGVVVDQRRDGGETASTQVFEDCGLTPDDFTLDSIVDGTILRIVEEGVTRWEWSGEWVSA